MSKPSTADKGRIAAAVIVVVSIFWLWFATRHDLVQDEAYYWQWSRHLAAGYYDGPPLVAYVIHLSTLIFGQTVLGVRFGAVLCAAITAGFYHTCALTTRGAMLCWGRDDRGQLGDYGKTDHTEAVPVVF